MSEVPLQGPIATLGVVLCCTRPSFQVQGYLVHKEPEISKRSVSASYLGGPIKKLSENARCPFLTY